MREEANTSEQTYSDPWLLAARNEKLLGFTYSGGKLRLADYIRPYMPSHGHIYCEPFAGLGALFWKMALSSEYKAWRLNDIRTHIFFRALATHGHIVTVPARSHDEFVRQKASFTLGDPAAILLGPYLSYNGGFYNKGERQDKGSVASATYEARLRMCHSIMMMIQPTVTALDWKLVVSDLGPDDFVYYDPPYANCNVGSYRANDIHHEELVEHLLRAPYRWLLSEYDHPLYAPLGRPFWRKEVQLRTTNFRNDGGKGRRVECLWRNYSGKTCIW
jgi:site-specific DNA-adenine methylase